VLLAVLEIASPRVKAQRKARWLGNLLMPAVSLALLRALPWVGSLAMALLAQQQQWGLFNQISFPSWLALVLMLALLDLAIYWQHRLMHHWPLLWRLHRVHHADNRLDVTTAVRFHPLEILLSECYKALLVLLLGVTPLAILLFAIILNGLALFNHANLALPLWLDRQLRKFIVTPDMHRVHHSVRRDEHDSNFGFCLSCWDHLFSSYRQQPRDGLVNMQIGLEETRNQPVGSLIWMLRLPFISK